MQWEDTAKIILSMDELIYTVLKCLKFENEKIIFVTLNFLEVVLLCDNKWSEKIKRKKFKINCKVKFCLFLILRSSQGILNILTQALLE